jgi:zinc/manganese transport system substrate-binding protein
MRPPRLLLRIALALAALAGPALPAWAQTRLPVVATFSILGDLVGQVGGERVAVTTLVQPDGDAHVYAPSPAEAERLARAALVVTNGLGLEGWIRRLIASSGSKAAVVEASRSVQPLAGEGDERERIDPHAWQSVANARVYVGNIRDALIAADPGGRAGYETRAAAYLAELDGLEAEVRAAIAAIPPAHRKIITTHDAFGYFAKAYGIVFIAPQGVSTETEASARDVARIVRQIKREKIRAVFLENISDPRLMTRIASETGARIGGKVYSDSLSPAGGPAPTYIAMMRHNIRAFAAALAD